MVVEGCQRCNGDLRLEEDLGSRPEDMVCLQCGHRQAVQAFVAGSNASGAHTNMTPWLIPPRPSRMPAYDG